MVASAVSKSRAILPQGDALPSTVAPSALRIATASRRRAWHKQNRANANASTGAKHPTAISFKVRCRAPDPSPKRQRGVEHRSFALPARKERRVNAHGRFGYSDESPRCHNGAERARTADLLVANQALSQLSYGP